MIWSVIGGKRVKSVRGIWQPKGKVVSASERNITYVPVNHLQ